MTFYALIVTSSRYLVGALDSPSDSTAHFPSTAMQAVAPGFFNLVLVGGYLEHTHSSLSLVFYRARALSLGKVGAECLPTGRDSRIGLNPLIRVNSFAVYAAASYPAFGILTAIPSLSESKDEITLRVRLDFFLSLGIYFAGFSDRLG